MELLVAQTAPAFEGVRTLPETGKGGAGVAVEPTKYDEAAHRLLSDSIAHDLNNLLCIISNLAALQQRSDGPWQVTEQARRIQSAVKRASALTQKLSSLSRLSAASRIELSHGLGEVADLARVAVGEKVRVRVFPAPETWPILVDPTEWQVAIVNLAINSAHAMPDGGTFTVSTLNTVVTDDQSAALDLQGHEFVEVRVTDSGVGMSADTLARAFEPYFTTRTAANGSGLGLAQVHAFARASGGAVRVSSAIGVGTTFTLYLPRAPGSAPANTGSRVGTA